MKLNKVRIDIRLRQYVLESVKFLAECLEKNKTDIMEDALNLGLTYIAKKNGYVLPHQKRLEERKKALKKASGVTEAKVESVDSTPKKDNITNEDCEKALKEIEEYLKEPEEPEKPKPAIRKIQPKTQPGGEDDLF